MKTIAELLTEQPFFDGLKDEWVELLAGCGQNVHLKSREYLFKEDDNADNFYLLRRGKVRLQSFLPGNPPKVFQTLSEGDVVGWSWIFPPYKCSYDAKVAEAVNAIMFDGRCMRKKCEANTDLGYELMKRFSRIFIDRLTATQLQLVDMYGRP